MVTWAALLGLCLLQGCYSLVCFRTKCTLRAPGRSTTVVVGVWQAGEAQFQFEMTATPPPTDPAARVVVGVFMSVVYYPVDVLFSTIVPRGRTKRNASGNPSGEPVQSTTICQS